MEHTVDSKQMVALEALAATNLKVSEARGTLIKLEETETEYLIGRERRAMERIQEVHDDSSDLLKATQTNYDGVHQILSTVSGFSDYLSKAYDEFKGMLDSFEERNREWEANCKIWEDKVIETKNEIKVEQTKIYNEKKNIERQQTKIEMDRMKIEDDRGTLERAITRLKENRI